MGKRMGFGRKSKDAKRQSKYYHQKQPAEMKKIVQQKSKNRVIKRSEIAADKKKLMKNAIEKYLKEISKTVSSECFDQIAYIDRVSRIETYISKRKHRKVFTLNDFVFDRYDIQLEWCYICHRTLFSKQANILHKKDIKPEIPKIHFDEMPEKVIVCHRCKNMMSRTKNLPAQSFWNNLYPGDIPKELSCLTSMEVRLIQRIQPFMKIVKYKGRFGQYGLQGQAVLFARDVCEVFDILPRSPKEMDLIMVVESLQNINRQKEMIIDQNRVKAALEWLLKNNERYKDVKIDMNSIENSKVDYSQICIVAPPINQNESTKWKKIGVAGVLALHCKRHELSEVFQQQVGGKSLTMCMSSIVKSYFQKILTWDCVDLDIILEEGYSLFVDSMNDITCGAITFDTIKKCFILYDKSIEIAIIQKNIFKRDCIYDFVTNCMDNYGCGIIYTNKVYISIFKYKEEYYFFDPRPRGIKGYGCIKNKKNEYNGGAIVMRFSDFNQFIKRLESQLKANKSTEYTLASVIVSEPNTDFLVNTFGDKTPSLHTNPIFKKSDENSSAKSPKENNISPEIHLSDLTTRLSLNIFSSVYASHSQADIRYGKYRNNQCTANSCAAIVKSLICPLSTWTGDILDEVLVNGNQLYIETCNKIKAIRYIAACEIVNQTIIFEKNISLKITWLPHDIAANLEENIIEYFVRNMYTNGILTCESSSYAIMFENNNFWFFDPHSNHPNGTSVLHKTNLNGLMNILRSKIVNSLSEFDISYVEVEFPQNEDLILESRLELNSDGKHSLSDTRRPNEILKKIKSEVKLSTKFDFEHGYYMTPTKMGYQDDFGSVIDENDGMSPYRHLFDTRNTDFDFSCRFMVTPLKTDPDSDKYKQQTEHYERRLNLMKNDIEMFENIGSMSPAKNLKETEGSNCYITTASNTEKYRFLAQLDGFDTVACIVAILNQCIDSFTGWSTKRLQSVLDEADKLLPSFNMTKDSLIVFDESFHYDNFFYGNAPFSDIKDLLESFFQIHEYGVLRYNNKEYSISYSNDYFCFFDPHSCNPNGYPSQSDVSCVIITKNFDTLIDIIADRVTYDDKSLRTTIENNEKFILFAVQIERINNLNIVQKNLNYDNMCDPISILSSVKHIFSQETQHLCTVIAAVASNFINSFENWSSSFINLILQDGDKIFQNMKPDKLVNLDNDFNMFSISGLSLQTTIYEVVFDESYQFSNILNAFLTSYDSGIIVLNGQFYTIMHKDEKYAIFDSYGIDHNGSNTNACLITVNTVSQLEDLILTRAVRCQGNDDLKISFHRLDVTKIDALDFELNLNDLNPPKIPDVEMDTDVLDAEIECPISIMRPIDNIIPKTEELFDIKGNDIDYENIPLINIKRATKPPLSHKTNRRYVEFAHPVLYPYGINGLNEDRPIKMTALNYFQSRVMGKDPRFHSKEYLLFALNYVESEKIASNISVCGKIQQNRQNISNVASNLHLVMRTIRGTSAYWGNALLDLLAMVKVLGPGTAFLTLSCNDLNWDFMLKACLQAEGRGDVNPHSLSHEERQRLVENNPVMISRLFNREIQNLLKILKNGQALSNDVEEWKVTDYWYRIEWQQRGSPHCHMIIWIKDFPKLDSPEGIRAMDSLCRCDIPEDDDELASLVQRYQRHHCTSTCFKARTKPSNEDNMESKARKTSQTCRFAFPRQPCKETKVLDPESTEFIKNGHRLVKIKRNQNARFINNYNANILRVWKGNMDFQFITSQAIVSYVAKYSCKSEPSSLHKLINEAIKEAENKNEESKKTLFKLTMKILNERQVSCPESATRLCHLPMKGCSRKVVFINSSRPEERYRMLNIEANNPENNSYYSNIIDRYEIRPDDMEDMSLAEFAIEYEPHYHKKNDEITADEENGDVEFFENQEHDIMIPKSKGIKLKDGKSYIKKRGRSAIFRSRYFSLIDNRPNYFYGLLLLHLPFRSEKELLQKLRENNETPIEYYAENETDLCFFEKKHLLRPFNSSCTVDEYLQYSLELQEAIRQLEVVMNGLNSTPEEDNSDEQITTVNDDIRDGEILNVEQNIPSANLLNSDQRKLFKLVQEWIGAHYRKEKLSQLLMFTTGSAGTGKSFLIAQIIKIVKDYFEPQYPNSKVIFVTAPTGIAARLINGQTLHNALSLGIEHGEISKYKALTGDYLKQKREQWKDVKFLIIDEISMVSYEMLKNIDLRLKELMSNTEQPFGGINVLTFGDLMQLPPVLGHSIYERPHYTAELHLWRLFDFCELKQNMRQKNDQSFIELLNALRIGDLNHEHRKMLTRRVESDQLKREGIFDDMSATLIAPINKTVAEHNEVVLQKLITKNREIEKDKYRRNPEYKGFYLIRAIDELQVKNRDPDWEKFIPKDDNKCAGVPKELKLAIGARVMLRRNIDVSRGLVNGSLGIIKSFNWGGCFLKDQSEPGDLPESVTVTFDGIGDVDIKPQRCEFNAKCGKGKVDRLQLPLILAWAVTAHKLQGVTVEIAVIDLGSTVFEKGQAYVMLSRVKNLDKVLILRNFDVTKLERKYVNTKAITEMNRLRNLNQVDSNILLQTRELSDSRIRLN